MTRMFKKLLLAALLALLPFCAVNAQGPGMGIGSGVPIGPPPWPACGQSITQCQQVAPRTNTMVWAPWTGNDQTQSATKWLNGTGGVSVTTLELEDDYDAVQIIFANGSASPFTVGQASVSASSRYGLGTGGISSFDTQGTALTTMLPVSFNNNGALTAANLNPYPPALSLFNGNNATSGAELVALSLSSAAGTTLTFASTASNAVTGNYSPVAGMFVGDGVGCVSAGATVSSVTATTVVITGTLTLANCTAGLNIYFSYKQITQTNLVVAASTNAPEAQMLASDWIPLSSLPRSDGCTPGDIVAGNANIPANATALSVGPTSINLSAQTTGTISSNSSITCSESVTTTLDNPSGSFKIYLTTVAGMKLGETVTGSGNIPGSTTIVEVQPNYIRLSAQTTGDIAPGTTLTFTKTSYVSGSQTSGTQTLALTGTTNQKPLLTIRTFISSGSPWSHVCLFNICNLENKDLGLPLVVMCTGPATTDGLNFVGNVTNSSAIPSCGQSPIYAVRYLTRHRGVVEAHVGDSHIAGDTTVSGNAAYPRLAANAISTPTLPVTSINAAMGGQSPRSWIPHLYQWLQITQPGIVTIQASTGNGSDNQQSYQTMVQGLMNYVLGYGGRVIIATDYSRLWQVAGNLSVLSAVNAGTSIPLGGTVNGAAAPIGLYNGVCGCAATITLLSGSGSIPGSTTATLATGGVQTITASQNVTLGAGAVITTGIIPATTNGTTTVTLTTPAPLSWAGYRVTGTNIPASTTITTTANSTTATLSQAASGSGATTLTIFSPTSGALTKNENTMGAALMLQGTNSAIQVFDAWSLLEDPANPTFSLPQYGFDGTHADDFGHAYLAANFKPLLSAAIGN